MSETYEPTAAELAAIRNDGDFDAPNLPKKLPAFHRTLAQERSFLAPDPHRMLPVSSESEQAVLCSMLLQPDEACARCAERRVTGVFFHIPAHEILYSLIMEMHDKGLPIDTVTVVQFLHDRSKLEECGGGWFVSQISTFLPTAANLDYYLDILIEKWVGRESIRVHTQFASRAYEKECDVWLNLEEAERSVLGIRSQLSDAKIYTAHAVVAEAMEGIQAALDRPGSILGISTGFADIDAKTGGLEDCGLYVIAARPSHGKTALAMNIAEHIAVVLQLPVAIFSLEMSRQQLMQRAICSRARVNMSRVMRGHLAGNAGDKIALAAHELSLAPMFLDDQGGLTIQELRGRARRLKQQHGIRAIFVDYLQLLKSNSKHAQENRAQEVSEVSAGLKECAKELGLPVVALAQIGRDFEKRNVIRPRLSDLKESGSIEQDADFVGFLVREELLLEEESERLEAEGRAELMIAKQRNGPIGDVPLTFLKEFVRFEGRAAMDDPQQHMGI